MSIEAMKLALEALEALEDVQEMMNTSQWFNDRVTALRQAIEQSEKQKPVAYLDAVFTEMVHVAPARKRWLKEHEDKAWCAFHAKHMDDIPLYTKEKL